MKPATTLLLLAVVGSLLVGCQSLRSWDECPGIYSGVKYYADQVSSLPWDGRVFFAVDLPLTAVVDTLALPVTFFLEPTRPVRGYGPGCRWAGP